MGSPDRLDERVIIGCCNLITDSDGRYLLVKEAKASARGRFNLPAGKPEVGETLIEAAVREAREETGLEVEVDHLVGMYQCPETSEGFGVINFVFFSTVVGGSIAESKAHPVVTFCTRDQIRIMARSGRLRGTHIELAISDHLNGRQLPLDVLQVVAPSPFLASPELLPSDETDPALTRAKCGVCQLEDRIGTATGDGEVFICDQCQIAAIEFLSVQASIGRLDQK